MTHKTQEKETRSTVLNAHRAKESVGSTKYFNTVYHVFFAPYGAMNQVLFSTQHIKKMQLQ